MLIDSAGVEDVLADWREFLKLTIGARGDTKFVAQMLAGLASPEEVLRRYPELGRLRESREASRLPGNPMLIKTATDQELVDWFNEIGGDYGFMTSIDDQTWIMEELLQELDPDATTLDIGCGAMPHLIFLKSRGLIRGEITGLDPSAELIKKARKIARKAKVICHLKQGWGNCLSFDASSFGQAIAIDSLHWTSEWRAMLTEMARIIADNGVLLIIYSIFSPRREISPIEAIGELSRCGVDIDKAVRHESATDTPRTILRGIKRKPSGVIAF